MEDNEQEAILVVLGVDTNGKPHASRFSPADTDLVRTAAGMMGFVTALVSDAELKDIAAGLPQGRVFGTGRAFVPFVKRETYDRLATLLPPASGSPGGHDPRQAIPDQGGSKEDSAEDGSDDGGSPIQQADVDPWAALRAGDLVLSADPQGWWEAVVVEAVGTEQPITLRWRDFPDEPRFTVPRRTVAVIGSDAR